MKEALRRIEARLLGSAIRIQFAIVNRCRLAFQRLKAEEGDTKEVLIVAVAIVLLVMLLKWGKKIIEWIQTTFGSATGAPTSG